jgi:Kef-type K+ transport system membrane component KefB
VKLSVAPVFPIWLIVVFVLVAVGLRIAAAIISARRRGRMPDGREWLRIGMALVAIVCLGLAATRLGDESDAERPPRLTTTAEESNINVFLVIDRSAGMNASGFGRSAGTSYGDSETRLEGAVKDAQVVLTKYPDARFSVISYADTARVDWPISRDEWSLAPFLQNFRPYGERSTDGVVKTDVTAANSLLKEQLNAASRTYPGSANLVFIFGAGSDSDDAEFDIPLAQVSGGAVFGYGTNDTKPRIYAGPNYDTVDVPLNEEALTTAADSLGIPFQKRESGLVSADELPSAVPQAAPADPINPKVPHPDRTEFYWFFAAIAAALFGVELYGLAGHWLRRRRGTVRK